MHKIYEKRLLMLRPDELNPKSGGIQTEADRTELAALARSIAASGIIQPLAVRKNADGKYELITGARRLKAAVTVGLRRVPCIVHKTDECTAALYSLTENMQRASLPYLDEAAALERIMLRFGLSVRETAARLGISPEELSDRLCLLRLDREIREKITASHLPREYAALLLKLPEEKRFEALERLLAENMTLTQAARQISDSLNQSGSHPNTSAAATEKPYRKSAIGDVRLFSNSLDKLVEALKSSGISANSKRYENDKYIEYRVRIKKASAPPQTATQLKIC